MNPKSPIAEIESVLLKFPQRTSKQNPEAYIGGGQSKLRYLGLKVPHLRKALADGFSFSHLPTNDQAKIWNQVWKDSDCYEVMSLALAWFYLPKQTSILKQHWPLLKKWSNRIDNWAHSDTLSGIYARILEESPELVYPVFQKWNQAKNPWLRRLSIVSLLYYSSQRKQVLPLQKILTLVELQIDFDHYYVQKGVGWTLRETGNVYPADTFLFLQKNITRISAHAFSAATEKLDPKKKAALKDLRKKSKSK